MRYRRIMAEPVLISSDTIRLDHLLSIAGVVDTGGQAKRLIQSGLVRVDGEVETRRSHRIAPGARVAVEDGPVLEVVAEGR